MKSLPSYTPLKSVRQSLNFISSTFKISLTCLILLLCSGYLLYSQTAPSIDWQKSFGGDSTDKSFSVLQTTDNGYLVAGSSKSNNGDVSGNHGRFDAWIIKLDSSANIQWQKCLGGSKDEEALAAAQTTDGGFIIAGYAESNDGDVTGHHGSTDSADCWIVKLDPSGNITWQKSLGGTLDERALSISEISGGFIFGGLTTSNDGDVSGNHGSYDCWIVNLDASGNLVWQKCLGGSADDHTYSVQSTSDGGIIATGWTQSNDGDVTGNHGAADYWVIKLNSLGNIQWQKCFGGVDNEKSYGVRQTDDGGYIVAGYSRSDPLNYGDWDYWIIKLDSAGNSTWEKNFGGSLGDAALSVEQLTDASFIVGGYSESVDIDVSGNHGGNDYWIVNIDATGNLVWEKSVGGSLDEKAYSIQPTSSGGFIIAGISISNDGDVSGNHGEYDAWVVHLDWPTAINEPGELPVSFSMFPNPSQRVITVVLAGPPSTLVNIKVLDVAGKELYNEYFDSGNDSLTHELDLTNFSTGTYLVEVICNGHHEMKKLLVQK